MSELGRWPLYAVALWATLGALRAAPSAVEMIRGAGDHDALALLIGVAWLAGAVFAIPYAWLVALRWKPATDA